MPPGEIYAFKQNENTHSVSEMAANLLNELHPDHKASKAEINALVRDIQAASMDKMNQGLTGIRHLHSDLMGKVDGKYFDARTAQNDIDFVKDGDQFVLPQWLTDERAKQKNVTSNVNAGGVGGVDAPAPIPQSYALPFGLNALEPVAEQMAIMRNAATAEKPVTQADKDKALQELKTLNSYGIDDSGTVYLSEIKIPADIDTKVLDSKLKADLAAKAPAIKPVEAAAITAPAGSTPIQFPQAIADGNALKDFSDQLADVVYKGDISHHHKRFFKQLQALNPELLAADGSVKAPKNGLIYLPESENLTKFLASLATKNAPAVAETK